MLSKQKGDGKTGDPRFTIMLYTYVKVIYCIVQQAWNVFSKI